MKTEKNIVYITVSAFAFISFLVVFLVINPVLHYSEQQIAWLNGNHFFNYYLTFPGGLAEYFTLFISQLFYSKWAGSVVVAIIPWLIAVLLAKITFLKTKSIFLPVLFFPLIQVSVLSLMSDHLFNFSMVINLFIVSLFLFCCFYAEVKFKLNLYFSLILSLFIIYIVSGGVYFLIFTISAILLLFFKPDRSKLILASILIILAGLIPWFSYKFIYLTNLEHAFLRSVPDVAPMLRYSKPTLFLVTLGIIPLIIAVNLIAEIFRSSEKKKTKKNTSPPAKSTIKKLLPILFQTAGILVFAFVSFYYSHKPQEKLKAEIKLSASQGKWDDVLLKYPQVESYDRMVNFQFNRAIAHSGQMLEQLFNYPQVLGTQGLFLDRPFTSEVALPNSDLYFDLGNIDESQRFAFESQTLMAYSPLVLKRLILNSLILEDYEAAKTFSNVLSENPVENDWLKKYENILENPEKATDNKLVAEKRNIFARQGGLFFTPRDKMLILLNANSHNKMAFEYLIAFDLMEHDLASFSDDMKFYNDQGYKKLPKTIEEAVVLFLSQRPDNQFLRSFHVSPETVNRFREFVKAMNSAKGNKEKAKIQTAGFSNTYWYYVLFVSPVVTKVKLETKPSEANY